MSGRGVGRLLMAAMTAVVVLAIAGALRLIGPPSRQRELRFDERRVDDLNALTTAIDRYWSDSARLPASLAALKGDRVMHVRIADPETGVPYEYAARVDSAYSLCSVFGAESPVPDQAPGGSRWTHGKGRVCFDLHQHPPRRDLHR